MINYLIIGNQNAITYKEIFPFVKENKMWLGVNQPRKFIQVDNTTKDFGNIYWFTNMMNKKRSCVLELKEKYSKEKYLTFDNYNAINVDKVSEIPIDYSGIMGVPITFLDKYNPNQFEIVGCPNSEVLPKGWKGMSKEFFDLYIKQGNKGHYNIGNRMGCFIDKDGKARVAFSRILIKNKQL